MATQRRTQGESVGKGISPRKSGKADGSLFGGKTLALLLTSALWLTPGAAELTALPALAMDAKNNEPATQARPVADKAELAQSADRAKLLFSFSAPVSAEAFVLADPDRVIVDLPQSKFALDPETGRPGRLPHSRGGLISSFRFGQIEPGKSRIVIDLSAPAKIMRVDCEAQVPDGRRALVIELARTDPDSFSAAVQASRRELAAHAQVKTAPPPQPVPVKPVILLDPGHGGIDRGAVVKGLVEKEIVLEFAKTLAARLEAQGRYKIVMTRSDDRFVSLSDRVQMARDNQAALLVSIHADTLSESAGVSGATVYTLSSRASDAEAARLAEKENQADLAAGLDKSGDSGEVSGILFDLTRRETRAFSHLFARTLVNYWRLGGHLNKNPRRSAGFRVLTAPDVPSVLLELGYLTNAKDSAALTSPEWRETASSQVAEAVGAYFAAREGGRTVTSADPDPSPVGKIPAEAP
ncbi:MAG TPA: N-acetylmuramoyl-L-alanine amidase [Methylocella sp.]|nr:N-acetylmuramoyl-L-alanine amidase [Methylocella sp.]